MHAVGMLDMITSLTIETRIPDQASQEYQALSLLTNLQHLDLRGYTGEAELILSSLQALTNLKTLRLYKFMSIEDPSPLGQLSSLEKLNLNLCLAPESTEKMNMLSHLVMLRELDLGDDRGWHHAYFTDQLKYINAPSLQYLN